jgi:hypothetical protein
MMHFRNNRSPSGNPQLVDILAKSSPIIESSHSDDLLSSFVSADFATGSTSEA